VVLTMLMPVDVDNVLEVVLLGARNDNRHRFDNDLVQKIDTLIDEERHSNFR